MNLYALHQDKNDGYDTYDSAVVAAAGEDRDGKAADTLGLQQIK